MSIYSWLLLIALHCIASIEYAKYVVNYTMHGRYSQRLHIKIAALMVVLLEAASYNKKKAWWMLFAVIICLNLFLFLYVFRFLRIVFLILFR